MHALPAGSKHFGARGVAVYLTPRTVKGPRSGYFLQVSISVGLQGTNLGVRESLDSTIVGDHSGDFRRGRNQDRFDQDDDLGVERSGLVDRVILGVKRSFRGGYP